MTLTYEPLDDFGNDKKYTLILTRGDCLKMRLDDFDRALLKECYDSDKVSDKLLALETIARRIEQAANVA